MTVAVSTSSAVPFTPDSHLSIRDAIRSTGVSRDDLNTAISDGRVRHTVVDNRIVGVELADVQALADTLGVPKRTAAAPRPEPLTPFRPTPLLAQDRPDRPMSSDRQSAAELLAATLTNDRLTLSAVIVAAQRGGRVHALVAAMADAVVNALPELATSDAVDRLRAAAVGQGVQKLNT